MVAEGYQTNGLVGGQIIFGGRLYDVIFVRGGDKSGRRTRGAIGGESVLADDFLDIALIRRRNAEPFRQSLDYIGDSARFLLGIGYFDNLSINSL